MSRLDAIFTELRDGGRTALMPFVTAGYPSLDVTRRVVPRLAEAGASIIELGVPFSDPIADGPVIAESMHEALASGITIRDVLDLVRDVRATTDAGLVLMVSHSLVARAGARRFVADAAAAGADGLIVPDLDLADAPALRDLADAAGMGFTMLAAPTTPAARVAQIAEACRGFLYLLARTGLTGVRGDLPDVGPRVAEVRAVTDLPLAMGFGISTAEQVRAVTEHADAAIVGSAIVRQLASPRDPVAAAATLVGELASALARRASSGVAADGPAAR